MMKGHLGGAPVRRDIVVMEASAGGVETLTAVVKGLPKTFPGSIFVALHVSGQSVLPQILERVSPIPVAHARDGEPIEPGRIYVAPPGEHLIIEPGHVGLSHSARENGHRPAIDPLFRTAARVYRQRVAGVALTGQLDDGAAGIFTVKSRGGVAIIQDPSTAVAPSMPTNASRYTHADFSLPPEKIGPLLGQLALGKRVPGERKRLAAKSASIGKPTQGRKPRQVPFGCPDCMGPLYEIRDGRLTQYTCEVGHTFAPESLDQAQKDALERALWIGARALRERVLAEPFLSRHTEKASTTRNRLLEHADQAERDLELIRQILDRF
jgi:two-component system, chemotaxis family, protein-glutamate methylesterase/glutaminase